MEIYMKKSLIAFAALAAVAGVAQAQSSVTLYGIVDAGISYGTGNAAGNAIGLTSGGMATPRWGVKGTEDLGGGLNAGFVLEQEINAGTGAVGGTYGATGNLATAVTGNFNRAALVSLGSSSTGTLSLGRFNRPEYDLVPKYDAFEGGNVGSLVRVGYIGNSNYPNIISTAASSSTQGDARLSNAAKFQSVSLSGVTVTLAHAFGGVAGQTTASSSDAATVEYSSGALALAAGYGNNNDTSGNRLDSTVTTFASYDAGSAKILGAYMTKNSKLTGITTQVYGLGAIVPLTAATKARVQYVNAVNANGTQDAKASSIAVGLTNDLSKRTQLYAIYAYTNNNDTAKSYASSAGLSYTPTAGYDPKVLAVGVKHAF